jgi:hypothetical protein
MIEKFPFRQQMEGYEVNKNAKDSVAFHISGFVFFLSFINKNWNSILFNVSNSIEAEKNAFFYIEITKLRNKKKSTEHKSERRRKKNPIKILFFFNFIAPPTNGSRINQSINFSKSKLMEK